MVTDMNEGKSFGASVRGLMGVLLLFLVGCGLAPGFVWGDDLVSRYNQLKREFQCSTVLPEKEKRTEAIKSSIIKLEEMVREDTAGKVSARCIYLIGQGHHHLYDATRNREHLKTAIEHYRQVTQKYPSSPIADDAQYLVGMLHMLDNPSQAYIEFAKVGLFFPKGDKRQKANEMAARLEKQLGCGPRKKKDSSVPPPSEFSASVSSETSGEPAARLGRSQRETSRNKSSAHSPQPASESTQSQGCPRVSQLERVNHVTGEEYTRVVLYTNGPVPFEQQITHADPKVNQSAKIAVLLRDCVLNPKLPIEEPDKDPFLKGVHAQQLEGAQSRVTLDVDSIDAYRIFSLSDPFRVIVDVRGKKPDQTASSSRKVTSDREESGTEEPKTVMKASRESRQDQGKPSVSPSLAQQLALDVKRIVIDPGHGGKDKGAIGPNKVYEKDIVLAIAKSLKKTLEERTDCEVFLTRTHDRFVSLEERTAIANAKKADLFISIHTNAHEDKSLHGIETYFLNLAKDKESARVAAFENATSAKKISDLEKILHDLMLNTKVNESRQLAKEVHKNLVRNLKTDYQNVRDLGTKQAPFYVLLGAEMPSILIESAFITNEMEESRLRDKTYQDNIATAITAGIQSYIQQMRTFASVGEYQ